MKRSLKPLMPVGALLAFEAVSVNLNVYTENNVNNDSPFVFCFT